MEIPVLDISQFKPKQSLNDFYINKLSVHVKLKRDLIDRPHSHNFYLCVIFTEGSGRHEIDFRSYDIKPGAVFFLKPGQLHFWKFDTPPEGYILFHSRDFYELQFLTHKLSVFPFFYSNQNPRLLQISADQITRVITTIEEMYHEYQENVHFKELKIVMLLNVLYIDFSRLYTLNSKPVDSLSMRYLQILENFEALIEDNFRTEKFPKFYADQLNLTSKHLNRVIKVAINKTSSELIADRVILEAKRQIILSSDNLVEIAFNLGFSEYSYFSRFFKIKVGVTPKKFSTKHKRLE